MSSKLLSYLAFIFINLLWLNGITRTFGDYEVLSEAFKSTIICLKN